MYILMPVLFWASCSDNNMTPGDAGMHNEEDVQVKLTIRTPASASYVRTRGVLSATDHESIINEIQVLVFEEGVYKYRVTGVSINSSTNSTTFTAKLKSSELPSKLFVLANSTDAVTANEPSAGDTEDVVKKKINREFGNITTLFPMHGEYSLPQGISTITVHNITEIKMTRALARIDVQATEVTNFKLTGVKAYRANNLIQVISNETGDTEILVPSVPAGSSRNVNSPMYAVTDEDMGVFSAQLYLPETDSPAESEQISGATCIVIEGYYNLSAKPTYYRIDFDPDNKATAFGQVLRNHKYIFNIKSVLSQGWDTPDEAANNRSTHLQVVVKAWDDSTTDMYFDGEHHFGVSTREVLVSHKANSTSTLDVTTDLPDYTLQWADAQGTPQGTAAQSLTNGYFKVEKAQSGAQLQVTALQSNPDTETPRTQNFIITANRWSILVKIEQRYDQDANRAISLLTFYSGLGYLGTNNIASAIAETRSNGLRGLLDNKNNFGPNGTVVCGGYNLVRTDVNYNKLTDALFAPFDVIYIHYMANTSFGNLDSQKVHSWLKAKKNRVLIISYDANDVNKYILEEIMDGYNGLVQPRINTGSFNLAASAPGNTYFTTTGPFTSGAYTPIPSGFTFRNYDAYHGEIITSSAVATGITPILTGPEGGIVLGVDYTKRIVYFGDVDLGGSTGSTSSSDNCINNTAGNVNNNASKLMANVFAWIAGTVLGGE